MARKKQYEEKQQHGTVELPVGLHKMSYPAGTDAIFYLHWHQEFEILMVTEGEINFEIEERKYLLQEGDGVFINSNLLHSARAVDGKPCSFFAIDFHYQFLHEDIHSRFGRKYLKPVLDGKIIFPEFISMRCRMSRTGRSLRIPATGEGRLHSRSLRQSGTMEDGRSRCSGCFGSCMHVPSMTRSRTS